MSDSANSAPAADAGTPPAADAAVTSPAVASDNAGAQAAPAVVTEAAPVAPGLTLEQKGNLKALDTVLEALFAVITPEELVQFIRALDTPQVALDMLAAFRAKIREQSNS